MTPHLFKRFCSIAYDRAGIHLQDGKQALVAARVAKRMRVLGVATEQQYLDYLEGDQTGAELVGFLDAISTNFTSFFREPEHFDLLADLVQRRAAQGRRTLRFWSAASSTGQEPYSMAMTVAESLQSTAVDWRLLATDISTRVLDQAKAAVYEQTALANVPRGMRARYFVAVEPAQKGSETLQVHPTLRSRVVFKRLNLSQPPFPMQGPLDAVFCRNVMIYFDQAVRQRLVAEIERLLAPDGLLCIGHAETLTGLTTGFRALSPSVYVKGISRSLACRRPSLAAGSR